MLDKFLLELRVGVLSRHLDEIEPWAECDLETYKKEHMRRYAIERVILIMVEYASNINRQMLEATGNMPAQSYYSTFQEIDKLDIISDELASRLGATTGLRNRLLHKYDTVRDDIVHRSLKPILQAYRQYVTAVRDYLSEQP